MRTKITVKRVHNLSYEEYRECYKANYGSNGSIRDDLVDFRYNRKIQAHVLMLRDDANRLMAWALVDFKESHPTIQIWVKGPYRRKGYGARLFKKAENRWGTPYVFPHNDVASSFFQKMEVPADLKIY